ncbi:MAG: 6-phosphogluconolactonase [Acidimicrobiales bacterium]
MKVVSADGDPSFADHAASFVMSRVSEKPDLVVTTPTGATPTGLYRRLVEEHHAGRFSMESASVFMLDEYVDLVSYPQGSFREYLEQNLGELVFNETTSMHMLEPMDDAQQCARYDVALDLAGGIDVAIIGVGRNGHVGFNEPGGSPEERTHVVNLAASTISDNFLDLDAENRPTTAVTVGLADIRRARAVLMLIAGEPKRNVARMLVSHRFDRRVPATFLLDHPDLTIIVEAGLLQP